MKSELEKQLIVLYKKKGVTTFERHLLKQLSISKFTFDVITIIQSVVYSAMDEAEKVMHQQQIHKARFCQKRLFWQCLSTCVVEQTPMRR